MRPILILVAVGAALLAFFVIGGSGHLRLSSPTAPNDEAIDHWKTPASLRQFSDLTWPLTPRARFEPLTLVLPAGASGPLAIASRAKGPPPNIVMAKIRVDAETAARRGGVAACLKEDGQGCLSRLCVCVPGQSVNVLLTMVCPAAFRAKSSAGRCPDDLENQVKIAIYPDLKTIMVINVGGEAVVVATD